MKKERRNNFDAQRNPLLYGCESWKWTEKVKGKLHGAASKMLATIKGRNIQEEARKYKRSDEGAEQKMELAAARSTHARASPGTPSPVRIQYNLTYCISSGDRFHMQ